MRNARGRSPGRSACRVVVTTSGWLQGAATAPLPRVGDAEDPSAIFLTSGSTGVAKAALLSHRATWLRAVAREVEDGSPGRNGEVVMFGLFHMAGWYFLEHAWAVNRAAHLVHRADADELLTAVERWRASTLYAIPAVWQRILDEGAPLRRVVTARSAHRNLACRPRPCRRVEGTLSGDLDIRGLRLHRDRPRRGLGRRRSLRETLERRTAATGGRGTHRRRRRTAAARPDDVLRLPRSAGRHREPRSTPTAGITRATSRRLTPTGTSRSPGAAPRGSVRAASGSPRSRWKRPCSRIRPWPRSGSSASPIPSGASSCARRSSARPGAAVPTVEELRAHLAPRLIAPKHPRVVVGVDRLPHTDATGQIRRAALRAEILAKGRA